MSFPPSSWPEFNNWVELMFHSRPNSAISPWQRLSVAIGDTGCALQELEQAELRFAEELNRATATAFQAGVVPWDKVSYGVSVLLAIRFETIHIWSESLLTGPPKERQTPIPFPPNFAELTEWFLVSWWHEQGLELAVTLWQETHQAEVDLSKEKGEAED